MPNTLVRMQAIGSVAALAVLCSISAACGAKNSDNAGNADGPAAAVTVTVRLLAFQPEDLSVPAGSEVRWRQEDPGAHTVTSGTVRDGAASSTEQPDGRFDSGEIPTGADFRFTFSEAGTYSYYCSLHPATMRGVIKVT